MQDPTQHAEAGADLPPASASWPIDLSHVTVRYPNGVVALKDVSLHIGPGEMVAVVGLSGSGKSTLIRTINGLVPVTSGTVTVGPHTVSGLSGRPLRALRGHVGMIFQGFNLADRASVYHNVLVGRFAHTPTWRTMLGFAGSRDREIAMRALDSVGMLEKVWGRAGALSGGQKQRVAIARTLSQEPAVMLADEPVASLDPPTAHAVMSDLLRINEERGLTVLVNLHLVDLARQYTTRVIGLRGGEVVYDGPSADATDADFEAIYGRPIQSRDRLERR
jgi:phosphonate transport system ATP-binding protein